MAYTKNALISRPVHSSFGVSETLGVREDLGDVWDTIKGGAGSVLDFFGAGLKAQGAQEALAAQIAAQQQAQAAAAAQHGGISTPVMLIGGLAIAGVLVFALRKK